MTPINTTIIASAIAATTTIAAAGLPNAHTWPMEHIMISVDDTNTLHAHVNTNADNPVQMLRFPGETYDGNAAVLNDQYYSDQYGWTLEGIVNPGPGNAIWIELIGQTDGLSTYEGGMRSMIAMQSFDPIFTTDTSAPAWQWSGAMTHNWYAAREPGDYQATYSVFIADIAGNPVDSFTPTTVTLNLRAVPTPAPLALLGLGALATTRRKRG